MLDPVGQADAAGQKPRSRTAGATPAPRLGRAWRVEADPGDDRCRPAADVLDGPGLGAAEPGQRLLDRAVRFTRRSEHPVGDGRRMAGVGLGALPEPVALAPRSHSDAAPRQCGDGRSLAAATSTEDARPCPYKHG